MPVRQHAAVLSQQLARLTRALPCCGTTGEEKLRKRVQFPEQLSLERAVHSGREMTHYRLAGLIEHIGATPRSGHYVAYARDADASAWLCFDDTTMRSASLEAVLSRPAYILAYERAA